MEILEFYGLSEDPFRLTPDPALFYPSTGHNEALETMNYAVRQRAGFCLVTGEPGTGKTTLINVFKNIWNGTAEIAIVLTPRLSPKEFLLTVLEDLNLKPASLDGINKNEILKIFRDYLIEKSGSGKPVIIIVDEAQNLPDETLEELRMLSNLETYKEKLLQIILVGQTELVSRLQNEHLRQLDQRLAVRATLSPLSSDETMEYINFRLIKAGKGFLKIDRKLLKPIHRSSQGIPRLINILASHTIMSAYVDSCNIVTRKHLKYAVRHRSNVVKKDDRRQIFLYAAAVILIAVIGAIAVGFMPHFAQSEKDTHGYDAISGARPIVLEVESPQQDGSLVKRSSTDMQDQEYGKHGN